jgi:hypothetical protein
MRVVKYCIHIIDGKLQKVNLKVLKISYHNKHELVDQVVF